MFIPITILSMSGLIEGLESQCVEGINEEFSQCKEDLSWINTPYGILILGGLVLVGYCLYAIVRFIYRRIITKRIGSYTYITTDKQLEDFVNTINSNQIDQIGIDTEYYRGDQYIGSLCLMQTSYRISNSIKVVLLDLVKLSNKSIQKHLEPILKSNKIEKIFFGCYNDLEWIQDQYGIQVINVYDIQEAYQALYNLKKKSGLQEVLSTLLGIELSKEDKKRLQRSNWKERPLSKEQLEYAANDTRYLLDLKEKILAIQQANQVDTKAQTQEKFYSTSYEKRLEEKAVNFFLANIVKCSSDFSSLRSLFIAMVKAVDNRAKEINLNPEMLFPIRVLFKIALKRPDRDLDFEKLSERPTGNNINEELYDQVKKELITMIQKHREHNDNEDLIDIDRNQSNSKDLNDIKQKRRKDRLIQFSCKSPIYENCKMIAPDGTHLCYCDTKKMNWYLTKGLATIVTENTFRLNFEPNATGCLDADNVSSDFYTINRENSCVVCGYDENYMRFHIVPVIYRQYLPNILKAHKSHDVILLCFGCHEKCNRHYDTEKKKISIEYDIPLDIVSSDQEAIRQLIYIIRQAAIILKNTKMPKEKRLEILNEVENFLKGSKKIKILDGVYESIVGSEKEYFERDGLVGFLLDEEKSNMRKLLERLKGFKITKEQNYELKRNHHGKLVVEKLNSLDNIEGFIKRWRLFFVESMQPKYLPSQWRIEHQFIRTFGKHSAFSEPNSTKSRKKNK